jgi:hypothetical protein
LRACATPWARRGSSRRIAGNPHHPQFPRLVGETAAKRLNSSPVAALLRSLGSLEACYRQIAVMATKFSSVAAFEPGESDLGWPS